MTDAAARLDSLLPRPMVVTAGEGTLTLPRGFGITGHPEWVEAWATVLRALQPAADGDPLVTLSRDDTLGSEAYRLVVTGAGIEVTAADLAGALHAAQSVLQLLPPECGLPAVPASVTPELLCCTVEDQPRYRWRGAHVDVSRHFMPITWLFSFVDTLALHKLNVLHLHLTDDQGWRFEVPGYPLLTEVGSHRPGTRYPHQAEHDGVPRGGFYTTAQLKALVAYAQERGITIVPEIDLPGHVRALLAAYPEYGHGDGQPIAVEGGIFDEVLWLDDRTMGMVEDVFTHLLDVFPSPYIHVGGDESPQTQWRDNPEADALAASRGLESFEQLQRWFTLHLRQWLADRGRRLVGWDEILDAGPVEDAVVMGWRGVEPGRRALAAGYQVVMAPSPTLYFDYYQSDGDDEPYGRPPTVTWQDVAAYDPAEGVDEAHLGGLLGVQGQVWTEWIPDPAHLEYMVFPRLSVLAEIAWRGSADPATLETRLRAHLERLDARGVAHRPLDGPHPWQQGGTGVRRRVSA